MRQPDGEGGRQQPAVSDEFACRAKTEANKNGKHSVEQREVTTAAQMTDAEQRFLSGEIIWREGKPIARGCKKGTWDISGREHNSDYGPTGRDTMTRITIPYTPPALGSNSDFQTKIFWKNREAVLSELRCL